MVSRLFERNLNFTVFIHILYGIIKQYRITSYNVCYTKLLRKYNNQFIIINNKKRGGWEVPGGTREIGETILYTASRELYEETGAVRFGLTPFGIYQLNESFGMVFFAEVEEMSTLPGFEIEEIKFEDDLPEGMNFGDFVITSYSIHYTKLYD